MPKLATLLPTAVRLKPMPSGTAATPVKSNASVLTIGGVVSGVFTSASANGVLSGCDAASNGFVQPGLGGVGVVPEMPA
jgi:hypothetical protein